MYVLPIFTVLRSIPGGILQYYFPFQVVFCSITFHSRWYFAVFSLSGVFSVTFSVVFAYVADITDHSDRTAAYGMVSVTH